MGVNIGVVVSQAPSAATTQDFVISGFGTPKAYLTFVTNGQTLGTAQAHNKFGVGASDLTREWSFWTVDENGQESSDSFRNAATDAVCTVGNNNSGQDRQATNNGTITDGVQIDWSGNSSSNRQQIVVVMFGGSDLTAYASTGVHTGAQDAAQNFTTTGMTADVIFFTSIGTIIGSSDQNHYMSGFGIATNEGTIQNAAWAFTHSTGNGTSDPYTTSYTNRCIGEAWSGGEKMEVTAFNSGNFTARKRDASDNVDFGYLALAFNGAVNFKLETYDTPTSGNLVRSGFGWKPQFVCVGMTFCDSADSAETVGSQGAGAVGVSLMTATDEVSLNVSSEDAADTTNTQSLTTGQAVDFDRDTGANVFAGTGPSGSGSFDSGGYTINMTTTDGTARKWFGLAIEEESAAARRPGHRPFIFGLHPIVPISLSPLAWIIKRRMELGGKKIPKKTWRNMNLRARSNGRSRAKVVGV